MRQRILEAAAVAAAAASSYTHADNRTMIDSWTASVCQGPFTRWDVWINRADQPVHSPTINAAVKINGAYYCRLGRKWV